MNSMIKKEDLKKSLDFFKDINLNDKEYELIFSKFNLILNDSKFTDLIGQKVPLKKDLYEDKNIQDILKKLIEDLNITDINSFLQEIIRDEKLTNFIQDFFLEKLL